MNLPHWVEQNIEQLPKDFSGRIMIHFWMGGVSSIGITTVQQAPKAGEIAAPRQKER